MIMEDEKRITLKMDDYEKGDNVKNEIIQKILM